MHGGSILMEECQRVDYMLYWCDLDKREKGFQKADAILLKLCEGFDLEEEMRIGFTIRDEQCWREFCNSKRKKERIIGQLGNIDRLTDDGGYRLGACLYLPQGLNFAKKLLDDFKTSTLFQGTDLENCRKGIEMLRGLMVETAEKMRPRLPKLLEEHSELIADIEDSDSNEAQESEETIDNICDPYQPTPGYKALTECDTKGRIMDKINTTDCDDGSNEPTYPLTAESNPWECEEEPAASRWAFAFAKANYSSNIHQDHIVSELTFGEADDASQGDSQLFQSHVDHGQVESRSDVPRILFEQEKRDLIIDPRRHIHARSKGEKAQSAFKSQARTLPAEDETSQGQDHKKLKLGLDATEVLQRRILPNTTMAKSMRQKTRSAAVLRQPLISDFLVPRGK
ncbi:hypothetical protein BGZ91_007772 [Linnemannia elongata]|nr:hypothetical protein BGZ91_007772 [Linnemannia elongata]